jgi:hypothetical protein
MREVMFGAAVGVVACAAVRRYRERRRRLFLGGRWHSESCLLARFPERRAPGVPGARMWCTCTVTGTGSGP